VGKTAVARATLQAAGSDDVGYCHFRPPIRGAMPTEVPETGAPPPKATDPGLLVAGWLRLVSNLGRFWLGYLTTVRPVLRRGGLVVADRWGYGYWGQPGALRFGGPAWLARAAVRLLPRPDVVINLTAPSAIIVQRKQELTADAVEQELWRWERLPVKGLRTVATDRDPPQVIAGRILEMVAFCGGGRGAD
jgi:hypothetical protein